MTTKQPCTNTTCGSYNPSLKNNCRHGFKDFKTFDCLGYVAERDKGMTKDTAPCCDNCAHCPTWKTGFAMAEDFESVFYKSGECKFNEEPILFTQGKYFVDGSRDGATELGECKNHTKHSYDKIIDRMEGEVPKNGR